MLENYEKFVNIIQENLNSKFEKQKPYIACKRGCSLCCEKGEYPFSEIEFKYIQKGFQELDKNTKAVILKKAEKIKEEKKKYKGEGPFMHVCPFLINNECSVYKYRGLVCRNFGLLIHREGKKMLLPFCANLGLCYSSVYDAEDNCISNEKYKKTGIEIQPLTFNVSYDFLTNESFARGYGFDFGEKRPLIDWF